MFFRLNTEAKRVEVAINTVLRNPEFHTSDLHGNCSTEMFMEELFNNLRLK